MLPTRWSTYALLLVFFFFFFFFFGCCAFVPVDHVSVTFSFATLVINMLIFTLLFLFAAVAPVSTCWKTRLHTTVASLGRTGATVPWASCLPSPARMPTGWST